MCTIPETISDLILLVLGTYNNTPRASISTTGSSNERANWRGKTIISPGEDMWQPAKGLAFCCEKSKLPLRHFFQLVGWRGYLSLFCRSCRLYLQMLSMLGPTALLMQQHLKASHGHFLSAPPLRGMARLRRTAFLDFFRWHGEADGCYVACGAYFFNVSSRSSWCDIFSMRALITACYI